ncbi:hypothetical protein HJA87_30605 [Rhizobium bangladeshense]|uniref:Uncharacterized protein n=1 Tax=Rhizobium bangladeshense TaxID=1138189 RepID=A0ABS7LS24_9HYPH|nr:hypothetical protein [Rhizobium bangladeshense]MBY3594183.1 hypothetical protein [Rhizobium bangladeshense]
MPDKKPAMITGLIDNWKLRSSEVKERLRLKYVPFSPTPEMIEQAEAFLSLSDAERAHRLETAYNEEAEFLISLETARALYVDPLDKRDGSITEAKVARYPERY